jgi:hypothetical protein
VPVGVAPPLVWLETASVIVNGCAPTEGSGATESLPVTGAPWEEVPFGWFKSTVTVVPPGLATTMSGYPSELTSTTFNAETARPAMKSTSESKVRFPKFIITAMAAPSVIIMSGLLSRFKSAIVICE